MKLLFRVYRRYFDLLKNGEKNVELRPVSKYWVRMARAMAKRHEEPWIGIFVCGQDRLERRIHYIEENVRAVVVLGRPLSEQGVKDLGGENPRVIAFYLEPVGT